MSARKRIDFDKKEKALTIKAKKIDETKGKLVDAWNTIDEVAE